MTIGTEERDKLERVRDLMRHRLPSGDLTVIFAAALDLLVAKLEKEVLGSTSRPRAPAKSGSAPARSTRAERTPSAAAAAADALARADASAAADALAQANALAASARTRADALAQGAEVAAGEVGVAKAPSRYVRRAVRRAVFARDGAQCTFRDVEGNRCPARGFLQLDHIEAFGLGGEATAENLRVRCGPHNHMHAEDTYGAAHVSSRIELRQRG